MVSLLLLASAIGMVNAHVARDQHYARGETPSYPYDSNTSKYCSYFIDNVDKSLLCTQVPAQWGISLSSFLRWVCLTPHPEKTYHADFFSAESLVSSQLQQLYRRPQLLR
jgi:hypothetical protein